jgi:hypothetical protein
VEEVDEDDDPDYDAQLDDTGTDALDEFEMNNEHPTRAETLYDRIDDDKLDDIHADQAAGSRPTRQELNDEAHEEDTEESTEAMETTDDDATDAPDTRPPLRRSEGSMIHPSKYVAAQLKECGEIKELP